HHVEARGCTVRHGWVASTPLWGDTSRTPHVRSLDQRREAVSAGVGAMKPPGTRLRALAARLLSASTMDYLVDPAIADMQAEYEDAWRRGLTWRKRWICL